MATMYSLFLGLLFTVICSDKGNGSGVLSAESLYYSYVMSLCPDLSGTEVEISKSLAGALNYNSFLCRSVAAARPVPFLLTEKEPKGQGLVARLNCLLISGNKTNSLRSDRSDCLSEIIDNSLRLAQPRPFYLDTTSRSLQSRLMSPVKLLTIAEGCTTVRSKGSSDKAWTLGRYQVSRPSGMEDRINIIKIASKELGIHEATGNNDGPRIEQYLRYTNLGKGYEWCSAFVSWCYGKAGFSQPRNPWSPALFPKARQIDKVKAMPADVFGIYGIKAKRINHVGLVKKLSKDYLVTIEGNSNDRVECRRRHLRTIYAIADWVE
ncbi:hypothetical protein SAMN05660841_04289 [Sphingobacterium nematocida]|uniref:CHAP domain-containing protein n=1 Tax=Sphingobacterium nematocida TaxID=1513896 RepID=A0A1T5GRB8_9SPHI|nr:hypothetical protein [Sphingobacterium nematocida]SKC10880.1 hypothetical protein SAMN05660841_04289 [Sphingobacterium nematocida]